MGAYASVAIFVSVKIPAYKLVQQMGHWFLIWARGEYSRANGPPSEPVLFVDNVQFVTNPNETAGDRLNSFNPATIDHIEVSNMIGSNLGANGANGAIYVFTKRATPDKFKSLPVFSIKGFDRTPVFTSPDYSLPNPDEAFDNRTTLYWNPSIYITPSKGEATVSFYASDQTGKYRVVVEGITSKGVPIHTEAVIVVEQ
jgi:hypothetical protein